MRRPLSFSPPLPAGTAARLVPLRLRPLPALAAALASACSGGGGSEPAGSGEPLPDLAPPFAVAGPDRSVAPGAEIILDASASSDDTGITHWQWDFDASDGIGSDASTPRATARFDTTGVRVATLLVSDAAGNRAIDVLVITVTEPPDSTPPVARAGADIVAVAGETVTLDGSASSDDVGIASWAWDFHVDDDTIVDASTPIAEARYLLPGRYTARLTVTDGAGNTGTDDVSITVSGDTTPPLAHIAPPSGQLVARSPIAFDGSASSDNLEVATWAWDFDGDGATDANGPTASWSWDAEGTQSVRLVVADAAGNLGETSQEVLLGAAVPVALGVAPDLINFEAAGESRELTAWLSFADGSREALADFEVSSEDVAVAVSDGSRVDSMGDGVTSLSVTAEGLRATIPVRVGPDLLLLSGMAPAFVSVRSEAGATEPLAGWETGMTPAALRVVGGAGFAVFSGDVWGGSSGSSVLRFDPSAMEASALFSEIAPAGAYDVAVLDDERAFLIGAGNGIVPFNPETGAADAPLPLAEWNADVELSLQSGSAALVIGDRLWISNSGLRSDFSYGPAWLLVWDLSTESWVDMDDSVEGLQPLALGPSCANPGAMARWREYLLVGCSGDYGALTAGVASVDLVTQQPERFVPAGSGYAAGFGWDEESGLVLVGSALDLGVGLVDAASGTVLRALEDGPAFDRPFVPSFDFTPVTVLGGGDAVVFSGGTDTVFRFPIGEVEWGDRFSPWLALADGESTAGFQFAASLTSARRPEWLREDNCRILGASGPGPYSDPAALFGPAHGGGDFSANEDPADLLTLPDGGVIEIHLMGRAIIDAPGPDFVVFENALIASGSRWIASVDPAVIELSPDGRTWVRYPTVEDTRFRSGTLSGDVRRYRSGFVGVEPVWLNADGNSISPASEAAGGDRFDLADVGLPEVRAIRIRDIVGDAGRADIDAVSLLHWRID